MRRFIGTFICFLLISCSHNDSIKSNQNSLDEIGLVRLSNESQEMIRVNIIYKDKTSILQLLAEIQAEVINHNEDFFLVTANITRNNAIELINSPFVYLVEEDEYVQIQPFQSASWDKEMIKVDQSYNIGLTGKGIKIAVLDTGVFPHNDLSIAGGASFVDYTNSYSDDNGHGTHVAGIIGAKNNSFGITGVAPECLLYSVKVLDQNGTGYVSSIVSGIEWAIEKGMDIVNISIGSREPSTVLKLVLDKAYSEDILIVSAAGNDGTNNQTLENTINYPAKFSNTIAVGAVDQSKNRANFSSFGDELELVAPGSEIVSTYLNHEYAIMDGTSMAAPFISGIAALLMESNQNKNATKIRDLLRQESVDLGLPGRDPYFGYGLAQAPYFFNDIDNHWAKNEIIDVYQRKWLRGVSPTKFAPKDNLTRAQAAVILTRMLHLTTSKNRGFSDVPSNHWAAYEINAVAEHKIMQGRTSTSFEPKEIVTREEFAVILDRVFIQKNIISAKEQSQAPFQDIDESHWSANSISRISQLGIINGVTPTKFQPKGKLTRAQMAVMLSRGNKYFE
jgi:subtilisin family serine protease